MGSPAYRARWHSIKWVMSFQSSFQTSFQSSGGGQKARPIPNGNLLRREYVPRSYEISRFERLKRQVEMLEAQEQEVNQDLVSQELKIREKELQRLRNLADKRLQMEILELLAFQNAMLNKRNQIEIELKALRDEEEAIIVILLTMGF